MHDSKPPDSKPVADIGAVGNEELKSPKLPTIRRRHSCSQIWADRLDDPASRLAVFFPGANERGAPLLHIDNVSTGSSGPSKHGWVEVDRPGGSRNNHNSLAVAACWIQSQANSSFGSQVGEAGSSFTATTSFPAQATPSGVDSLASSAATGGSYLPALQDANLVDHEGLKPLAEDIDLLSFDLVAPAEESHSPYSIEARADLLFSVEHLRAIFDDPKALQEFTTFLHMLRPESAPLLKYYLNSVKALKAIRYANAIIRELAVINSIPSSKLPVAATNNSSLMVRANEAFEVLAREELPAYITHVWSLYVSMTIKKRITNTLPFDLRDLSEDVAKVFCLTDPSRHDNPIIFASQEFYKASQYGRRFALGRNCRFLQGPKTDDNSIRRLRQMIAAGTEHCETLLNYRRDGSIFMNLLMVSPLHDNRGNIRYHLGTQVDVSGLVRGCDGLMSLKSLVVQKMHPAEAPAKEQDEDAKESCASRDALGDLVEMFTLNELKKAQASGGAVHGTHYEELKSAESGTAGHNKRQLLDKDKLPPLEADRNKNKSPLPPPLANSLLHNRSRGILENYLLVRPFPTLRILFASPSLLIPGILQSSFLSRIGGSPSKRDALSQAFAHGKSVTTKVRWLARPIPELKASVDAGPAHGRSRWIQTTPLFGVNGVVGVWVVVLVNDEEEKPRVMDAPPVEPCITNRKRPFDGGSDGPDDGAKNSDNGVPKISTVGSKFKESFKESSESSRMGGCKLHASSGDCSLSHGQGGKTTK